MTNVVEEIKRKREEIKKLEKEIKEIVPNLFQEGIKDLFEKHDDLQVISWYQHTPSFNDGDPCYFSSSHDWASVILKSDNLDEGELDDAINDEFGSRDNHIVAEVRDFLKTFSNNDMLNMFDDHQRITITNGEVAVDYYEGW
jgi:hypothetical protein